MNSKKESLEEEIKRLSKSGKIKDYSKWSSENLEKLQDCLPKEILKLNLDLKALSFYYINNIKHPILCNNCKKPLLETSFSLNNYGIKKCSNCRRIMNNGSRSPFEKAVQFSKKEENPYYKDRILKTYEIFYDDNKINEWAIKFKEDFERKPTRIDFKEFFGRKFPRKDTGRKFNRNLFSLWDSYLELKCIDYLRSLGYIEQPIKGMCHTTNDFVRNSIFKDLDGERWQIDILFPRLGIGFEVQDFTTHSKDSDFEPYLKYDRGYKHGPTYHEAKRKSALKEGIVIIEIWEDEIRDKSFIDKIKQVLGGNQNESVLRHK